MCLLRSIGNAICEECARFIRSFVQSQLLQHLQSKFHVRFSWSCLFQGLVGIKLLVAGLPLDSFFFSACLLKWHLWANEGGSGRCLFDRAAVQEPSAIDARDMPRYRFLSFVGVVIFSWADPGWAPFFGGASPGEATCIVTLSEFLFPLGPCCPCGNFG